MSIKIPLRLLHEAKDLTLTIELKTGEVYRGTLVRSEDNMNLCLKKVVHQARDGTKSDLDQVYIRGAQIRYIQLPDILKYSALFESSSSATASTDQTTKS